MLIDRPILLKSTLTYTINEHARLPTLYQAQPEVNLHHTMYIALYMYVYLVLQSLYLDCLLREVMTFVTL